MVHPVTPRRAAPPWGRLGIRRGGDLVWVGGRLDAAGLYEAYRSGVFPWSEPAGPVLWWSPDPRAVLAPGELHVPRRLLRVLARNDLQIRLPAAFETVMRACAAERDEGTWIDEPMVAAYTELARQGRAFALSVERAGQLVAGIYGVAVGRVFCAESMFRRERDLSKVALVHLVRALDVAGCELVDVQHLTPHLARFGCKEIPRAAYLDELERRRDEPLAAPFVPSTPSV